MKQAGDSKTLELHLAEAKRGRGRPAKADALTPAERAKRYRDAKRAQPMAIKRDVTENEGKLNEHVQVQRELRAEAETERNEALTALHRAQEQLKLAEDERNAAFKDNARLTQRNQELQWTLDREHQARIEAENKLAAMQTEQASAMLDAKLKTEVQRLKKELKARDLKHAQLVQAIRDEHAMDRI